MHSCSRSFPKACFTQYKKWNTFLHIFDLNLLQTRDECTRALEMLFDLCTNYPDLLYSAQQYTVQLLHKMRQLQSSMNIADWHFLSLVAMSIAVRSEHILLADCDALDVENSMVSRTIRLASQIFDPDCDMHSTLQFGDFAHGFDPVLLMEIVAQ